MRGWKRKDRSSACHSSELGRWIGFIYFRPEFEEPTASIARAGLFPNCRVQLVWCSSNLL